MKYKAIIFDMDGTLLDSLQAIADAMNNTLRRFGFAEHDAQKYRYLLGNGVHSLVCQALPEQKRTEKYINECVSSVSEEYKRHWHEKIKPYEGIPAILKVLKGRRIKLAVLSNSPHNEAKEITKVFFSEDCFDLVVGEKTNIPRKPDPVGALEIARKLNINSEQFIFVGDTEIDVKTAKAAGMFSVGVLWGFRTADDLAAYGADMLINKPQVLLELLE